MELDIICQICDDILAALQMEESLPPMLMPVIFIHPLTAEFPVLYRQEPEINLGTLSLVLQMEQNLLFAILMTIFIHPRIVELPGLNKHRPGIEHGPLSLHQQTVQNLLLVLTVVISTQEHMNNMV